MLVVGLNLSGAACYYRSRPLGWAGGVVGVVGVIITLITLYDISDLAAGQNVDSATGPWQNLGSGGWLACAAFFLIGAGGVVAATAGRGEPAAVDLPRSSDERSASERFLTAPGASRALILAAMAAAFFYPPTATPFWQQVLVSEIGIYVLLAIGLNVVVGWAGLLDLGFIAFYAIGSYTTAYLTGSLPVKPPSWLEMTPLLAIPFAIGICLLAGVLLGAPTLRLRGDYLAIVTLGFGEIIRIIAVNADGLTNGSRGPSQQVPHPEIHIGPLNIVWGLNQLQYWYLLLFFIIIVVILFRRLENSRIGRSWAAIREDEVAAQATGINTFRIKLLAFAIGASTSGLAGVFFGSQVGFFNPDNFILNNSILVVAYVVFGGMGSLPGAMAGAALLTWLPEFLKDQVPGPDRQMWIGAVVLLMMIFRPGGLIPAKRRAAELRGLSGVSSAETVAVPAGEGMGVSR
jgi:ABC-type branched-subunit amino acid transport system permease subunit